MRSVEITPLELTKELEERLTAEEFRVTMGVMKTSWSNADLLKEVLRHLLVDEKTMRSITGGLDECSISCLNEEGDKSHSGYKFVDRSRFRLSGFPHTSRHV